MHTDLWRKTLGQLDVFFPLIGHVVLVVDCPDRASGDARASTDAVNIVDVKLVFALVKTIYRADFHAIRKLATDARLGNDVLTHINLLS